MGSAELEAADAGATVAEPRRTECGYGPPSTGTSPNHAVVVTVTRAKGHQVGVEVGQRDTQASNSVEPVLAPLERHVHRLPQQTHAS